MASYQPVTDEYRIRVLASGTEQTWPHADRTAFTAIARLPGKSEDTGCIALSMDSEDVECKVESTPARSGRVELVTTLVTLPLHDVQIQPWFAETRVIKREARLSHNCQLM